MNLEQYIASKKAPKTIKAAIQERWQSRVAAGGLDQQGEAGAQIYLSHYGKSIAAPKCLDLAFCAMGNNAPDFAKAMFKKAAELEGITLEVSDAGNPNVGLPSTVADAIQDLRNATAQAVEVPAFPSAFQPGKFVPMQPVDAKRDREHYIAQPGYWGQRKVDGQKLIVFATGDNAWYQSRQLKLNGMPNQGMDREFRRLARDWGAFILEGELTFLDFKGGEHRTAAQALTASAEAGVLQFLPRMRFYVFSCPWAEKYMLRTYGEIVDCGFHFASELNRATELIEPLPTAKTTDAKQCLTNENIEKSREGEVWFSPLVNYQSGKHNHETFVRTKYLTEFEAIVTGFTETTAEGHAFGAMEIQSLDGKPLGSVGTGFTREDKWMLKDYFGKYGPFKVEVISQGFTEQGLAWHSRYRRIIE